MFRRLRAWWDAPLFSMPHRANERQIPMFTHIDCPPTTMYFMNSDTVHFVNAHTGTDASFDGEFAGWF